MKYGHINSETGRRNSPTPLKRLNLSSSRTISPAPSRLMEETREEIKPEVVWALARFNLNIL